MVRFTSLFRSRPTALIAIVAAALALLVALVQAGIVGASQDTIVTLVPDGNVNANELITLKLVARNAHDLAGYQGTVHFDTANLRLTGASVESGLGRDGRGLVPLGPVTRDGSVVLGAATCPIADCGSGSGTFGRPVENGVSGSVDLGTLEFFSSEPGSYTINLDGVQFVDPQGNKLNVRAEPFVLTVQAR